MPVHEIDVPEKVQLAWKLLGIHRMVYELATERTRHEGNDSIIAR